MHTGNFKMVKAAIYSYIPIIRGELRLTELGDGRSDSLRNDLAFLFAPSFYSSKLCFTFEGKAPVVPSVS